MKPGGFKLWVSTGIQLVHPPAVWPHAVTNFCIPGCHTACAGGERGVALLGAKPRDIFKQKNKKRGLTGVQCYSRFMWCVHSQTLHVRCVRFTSPNVGGTTDAPGLGWRRSRTPASATPGAATQTARAVALQVEILKGKL